MYTEKNYKTKALLKADFAAGKSIGTFQPGGMFPPTTRGTIALEGPHYPQPHSWYVEAVVNDGIIVKLDGKTAEQTKVALDKAAAKKAEKAAAKGK